MEKNYNECPICLIELGEDRRTIITFDCKHEVHLYCINEWKHNHHDHSEIYKCILCNENKDIINITNPIVNIVEDYTENNNLEINTNTIPVNVEIDNSCRGFFSAFQGFFRRLY